MLVIYIKKFDYLWVYEKNWSEGYLFGYLILQKQVNCLIIKIL
jgi:hypothetical protein